MAQIQRRKTISVKIGNVVVGGGSPVVVQSMTNTDTADVPGTIRQVTQLVQAGSELVRVTVNNDAAAKAVPADSVHWSWAPTGAPRRRIVPD